MYAHNTSAVVQPTMSSVVLSHTTGKTKSQLRRSTSWSRAFPLPRQTVAERVAGPTTFALRDYQCNSNNAFSADFKTRRTALLEQARQQTERSTTAAQASQPPQEKHAVSRIMKKLEARPSLWYIRMMGWLLCHAWNSLFSKIYVNDQALLALAKRLNRGDEKCSVILLPTHKSHIDYLLLSWLTFRYDLPMPFIAAGENLASIPVVGAFFRRCGAFFIQRGRKRSKRSSRRVTRHTGTERSLSNNEGDTSDLDRPDNTYRSTFHFIVPVGLCDFMCLHRA